MTNFDSVPANQSSLERSIDRALEQSAPVTIPEGFAGRVAARAAALPRSKPASQSRYGRTVALLAGSLLVVVLFALAPFADPKLSNPGFLAEMLVLAQLCGLAYWLSRGRREVF